MLGREYKILLSFAHTALTKHTVRSHIPAQHFIISKYGTPLHHTTLYTYPLTNIHDRLDFSQSNMPVPPHHKKKRVLGSGGVWIWIDDSSSC